jgi:hypothetical protein
MAAVSPADSDVKCQEQSYQTPRGAELLTGRISVVNRGWQLPCITHKIEEISVIKLHT